MKIRLPRKIKKKIPKGMYCYEYNGKSGTTFNEEYQTNVSWFGVTPCLLSFTNKFGYNDCKFLKKTYGKFNGEDDLDFALVDSCKSCGIKKDYGRK